MRSVVGSILAWFDLGKVPGFCPLCGGKDIVFVPLPDSYRLNAQRYGYQYFGTAEMTALETYSCSNCGASDRERLYAYWLQAENAAGRLSEFQNVIHFAPEAALSKFIRHSGVFENYQTADLMMDGVDHKVDLLDLPFANDHFDFFICSHVLEHVEDDRRAIRELHRITRKNGRGILMAPIIVGLRETVEDPSAKSEEDRWRLFGQFDHVRLYAHDDYVQKIEEAGFSLQQLGIHSFRSGLFDRLGLKATSILYVVTKK